MKTKTALPDENRTLDLFGGDGHPWEENVFVPSDDRARGGKSFSVLYVDGEPLFVAFTGHLDPTVLNPPAAFASQRTNDRYTCPDLSGYDALILDVPRSDGKRYTLVLKDVEPEKRPDGRDKATVSWEHDFHCPSPDGSGRVVLHFKNFKPFYRGKEVENATPLDRSKIKRIGIMIRSFFGKQKGGFALCMLAITAYKYRSDEPLDVGTDGEVLPAARDSSSRWATLFRKFGGSLRRKKRKKSHDATAYAGSG